MAFADIVLAAMSRLSRENRPRNLARPVAWNKRQVRLLERKPDQEPDGSRTMLNRKPSALRAGPGCAARS
jgi:hypothetical protein